MVEWLGIQDLTAKDYFLALPWLFIILGRLRPASHVTEWQTLYKDSETARVRAIDAMEDGVEAVKAVKDTIEAALEPIRERRREDDRP